MLIHLLALALTAIPPTDSDAPYFETFHRHGKTLTYVAATHHSQVQYPDALQDPVFKTVAYAFNQSQPEAVIVEGVDPSDLQGFIGYAKRCEASKYADTYCSEPAYTAQLAVAKGAQIYTGEPSARALLSFFESHGYTIDDYLGFIMMRQIPYAKTRSDLNVQDMLDSLVRQQNRLLGTSVQFTAEDFAQWYAKHMQTPRNYIDLTGEDGSPYVPATVTTTIFHTLSALSEQARDSNIVHTVQEALEAQDSILIVYGASHLTFEWNDLIRLMGKPRKAKPY